MRPTGRVLLVLAVLFVAISIHTATCSHDNTVPGEFLFESFDSPDWTSRWEHSADEKYQGRFEAARVDSSNSVLKIPKGHKFYGLTALLKKPLDPSEGLVVQYETKYPESYECGGSYIKLLTYFDDFKPKDLVDSTPYSVMFGPDKCGGSSKGQIHMILRHQSPVTAEITEKHRKPNPTPEIDSIPHVYTLIIKPDNTMQILVDGSVKTLGSLFENMDPPINPPKEIPDPADIKPKDWVDAAKIPDPNARRPDDWDSRKVIIDEDAVKPAGWLDNEPSTIPNKAAKKPAGWDDEEDGEWEPPKMPNPKCKKVGCGPWKKPTKANPNFKGEWRAPLIDNPDFKGPWIQEKIPNPDFFEDPEPLKSIGLIGAVAFELWTIDDGYMFDNVYIGQDPEEAARLRTELWEPRYKVEVRIEKILIREKRIAEEKAKIAEAAAKKKAEANDGGIKGLPNLILKAFDKGFLKDYKPHVAPLLDVIRTSPQLVYLVIIAPVLIIILYFVLSRKSSSDDAGYSKKHDRPADEESDEDMPKPQTKKDLSAHEITPADDEDEDDEDEGKKGARRRTRRAA